MKLLFFFASLFPQDWHIYDYQEQKILSVFLLLSKFIRTRNLEKNAFNQTMLLVHKIFKFVSWNFLKEKSFFNHTEGYSLCLLKLKFSSSIQIFLSIFLLASFDYSPFLRIKSVELFMNQEILVLSTKATESKWTGNKVMELFWKNMMRSLCVKPTYSQ